MEYAHCELATHEEKITETLNLGILHPMKGILIVYFVMGANRGHDGARIGMVVVLAVPSR